MGADPSDRNLHVPRREKERVLGPEVRGRPRGAVRTERLQASGGVGWPGARAEGCARARARLPRAALPPVCAPRGLRSLGAVARRGVQGALWPSGAAGAGGRSSRRDAGGFARDPCLQRLGRPTSALRPWSGSATLLRDPRSCGGPGARCGSAGAGPQQRRRPQPLQEREPPRRRLGPRRCPPEEAASSGTTSPAMLRRWRPLLENQTKQTESAGLAGVETNIMNKLREVCPLPHV
ncbi:uncharacterized protein ACDL77_003867 [Rhynchocyon petersi]